MDFISYDFGPKFHHESINEGKNIEPNTTQKLVLSSITIFKEKEQEQVSKRKIRKG